MKKMYTYKYKLLIFVPLLILLVVLKFGKKDVQSKYSYDKISMLSRFIAKEYCSCRFVVEQSKEYCENYIGTEIPIFGIRVNTKTISTLKEIETDTSDTPKKIISKVLWFIKAEALYYQNEKGCRILSKKAP